MTRPVVASRRRSVEPAWRAGRARRVLPACEHGAAAVEFALLAGVFFLLVLAVVELGRFAYANHSLEHAVREGLRFAVVNGGDSESPATEEDIQEFVRQTGASRGLGGAQPTVVTAFDPDNAPGSRVRIEATYPHRFVIPVLGPDQLAIRVQRETTIVY